MLIFILLLCCSCPMKCFQKLNDDVKTTIFNHFYSLKEKNDQDIYLQGLLEVVNVKRRSKTENDGNTKQKTCSFHHYVNFEGKRQKICQKAFLSVFSIGIKRLKRLKFLLKQNEFPYDKRGKNLKGNAISEDDNILIRQHIESFPVKEAHYSNKDYQYLNSRLNIKILYNLFKEKYPSSRIRYSYFVKYFHEHYDLHFGRPQVDTCCKCEELDIKIKSSTLGEAAKRAATAELAVHKRKAKKFYTSLKESTDECKNRDELAVLTFDYMQNVHLPEIPVQDLFYLTQLTVNIFGIHNCKTGKSFFYIYHEGIASKGPNEVCSLLWDYIQREVPECVQELRLYSDNCPGQNKNHTMIRMCAAFVETGKFQRVEQFYPIRGHSFLPNDRDFGVIKRYLKKHDRIFSVHEYTNLIIAASARKNFTVMEISGNEVIDFKTWWPKYYKKNVVSLETSKKEVPRAQKQLFTVSQFSHFIHKSDTPGYVVCSPFIKGLTSHTFQIHMPRSSERFPLKMPERIFHQEKVPILETKIKDISKVMSFIPEEYREFYTSILAWPTKMSKKSVLPKTKS